MADVPFEHVRDALAGAGFGGVRVAPGGLGTSYARAASCVAASDQSGPPDWAVISYVRTNAPSAVGGMPEYVANEVEDVLDSLLETKILKHRALWFDVAGIGRPGFTAAGVLHCLSAPVICVPPARIKEYARYQIPDKWDEGTYNTFVILEEVLRSCMVCKRFCPFEFDSRLLNLAATLRAWPIMEAILGSSGRGAFISFEGFDRFAHTIEWMQVLLHLSLEVGDYSPALIDKSIELYGQPLFRPCLRCVTTGKDSLNRSIFSPNLQMLEGDDRVTHPVWNLPGLQRSPGEGAVWRYPSNKERLDAICRRRNPSRRDLMQISANFLRGRPAEGSCFRHADKWASAAVINNISEVLTAFTAPASVGELCKRAYREAMRRILRRGALAFGTYIPPGRTGPHPELRKCRLSHSCTGKRALCLFNEHSGVLRPTSVPRFLRDCELAPADAARVARDSIGAMQARIHTARICYQAAWRPIPATDSELCCACHPERRSQREPRRLVLLGWDPMPSWNPPPVHPAPTNFPAAAGRTHVQMKQQVPQSLHPQHAVQQTNRSQRTMPAQQIPPLQTPASLHSVASVRNTSPVRNVSPVQSGLGSENCGVQNVSAAQFVPGGQIVPPGAIAAPTQSFPVQVAGVQNTSSGPQRAAVGQMGAGGATESEESVRSMAVPALAAVGGGGKGRPSPILAFVVVDAQKMEHVVASGVDMLVRAETPMKCIICATRFISLDLDYADEWLEVHIDNALQPRHAARRLYNGVVAAHDIFAAAA